MPPFLAARPWLIPAGILAGALLILVALQQLVGDRAPEDKAVTRDAVVATVRAAPADPFRFGGRNIGTVLEATEPAPGWQDYGWNVTPMEGGGFRAERIYRQSNGAERRYRFRVESDLDEVWPANDRARALMQKGE